MLIWAYCLHNQPFMYCSQDSCTFKSLRKEKVPSGASTVQHFNGETHTWRNFPFCINSYISAGLLRLNSRPENSKGLARREGLNFPAQADRTPVREPQPHFILHSCYIGRGCRQKLRPSDGPDEKIFCKLPDWFLFRVHMNFRVPVLFSAPYCLLIRLPPVPLAVPTDKFATLPSRPTALQALKLSTMISFFPSSVLETQKPLQNQMCSPFCLPSSAICFPSSNTPVNLSVPFQPWLSNSTHFAQGPSHLVTGTEHIHVDDSGCLSIYPSSYPFKLYGCRYWACVVRLTVKMWSMKLDTNMSSF